LFGKEIMRGLIEIHVEYYVPEPGLYLLDVIIQKKREKNDIPRYPKFLEAVSKDEQGGSYQGHMAQYHNK
jgi:hypothetical protein